MPTSATRCSSRSSAALQRVGAEPVPNALSRETRDDPHQLNAAAPSSASLSGGPAPAGPAPATMTICLKGLIEIGVRPSCSADGTLVRVAVPTFGTPT